MLEYFRFKEIHDLYTGGQIEEARHQLSELQARYVNLCDENAVLRTQIQGYEDILYLSRSLIFDGIFFWLITGSIKQGPFCPVCYNRDGLLLRLTDDGSSRHCLTCGSRFKRAQTPAEKPLPRQAVSGMAQGESLAQPAMSLIQGPEMQEDRRRATVIPFAAPGGR
ncbi:MAG: hypothetical protein LIP28_01410 [Deltaproteobacteria bacterium]|nr:hypothetical protein [Deltaproteobacteria bacterium]